MCSRHKDLLSSESEVVSSECDNSEQRCAPVSGDWLKKGGVPLTWLRNKPQHASSSALTRRHTWIMQALSVSMFHF